MSRARLWLAAVALVLSSVPADAQEITERDVVERVNAAAAARALRLGVDEARSHAELQRAWPDPALAVTREHAAGATDDFIVARQDLSITGRRSALGRAADARVQAATASADWVRRRLRADARLAFAALLAAQEREAALDAGLRELEGLVAVLRTREREQDSSRFDRLRAERETADVRADLADARVQHAEASGALASALALEGPLTSVARGALLPPEARAIDASLAAALVARGDYRAAVATVEALRFDVRAADLLRIPEPLAVGGLKRSDLGPSDGTGFTLGIELRLPVFGGARAAAAGARAVLARAEAERDALRAGLEGRLRAAHETARLRRAQAIAYRDDAAGGAELARIARIAYEEGEQHVLELLDAHRVALATQVRGIDLAAAARAAAIELDALTGEENIP